MNDEDTKIVNEETENLKNEGSKNSADVTPIVAVYREFKIWLKRLSDKTQERLIITFLTPVRSSPLPLHILLMRQAFGNVLRTIIGRGIAAAVCKVAEDTHFSKNALTPTLSELKCAAKKHRPGVGISRTLRSRIPLS